MKEIQRPLAQQTQETRWKKKSQKNYTRNTVDFGQTGTSDRYYFQEQVALAYAQRVEIGANLQNLGPEISGRTHHRSGGQNPIPSLANFAKNRRRTNI
jgi:hypothetical protein